MRDWWLTRFPIVFKWIDDLKQYRVPKNLNVMYCFGALAILVFIGQWLSGLWLCMFYTPSVALAYDSIQTMVRDVSFGWLLRNIHVMGASAFFLILYLHLLRSLLYGSYKKPRELVWILGVLLLLVTMFQAFLGQTLPWSQMSYWGAQVLTALLGVIPGVGDQLVTWFRGDFVVGDATLHRFFALHVVAIPVLLVGLIVFHVIALHQVGANNPDGIEVQSSRWDEETIHFYPDYWRKELLTVLFFLMIFFSMVCFFPNALQQSDHFFPANSRQTAETIQPMWYMLPYYSMLRAFPSKVGGVVVANCALLIWFLLPWLDKSAVRSMRYKGIWSQSTLIGFVLNFIWLGYLGSLPISRFILVMSQFSVLCYFAYFVFMPCYTRYELCRSLPERRQ